MALRLPPQDANNNAMGDVVKEQQRSSNLARIRDNQRRSRARRKVYLEDLEGRLRSCQQLGVEASAEIQAAARRVVDENKRLRQLLKQQGLSDAEIDGLPTDQQPDASLGRHQQHQQRHHTTAGALEGMLGTRKACSCDDGLLQRGSLRVPSAEGTTQASAAAAAAPTFSTQQQPGHLDMLDPSLASHIAAPSGFAPPPAQATAFTRTAIAPQPSDLLSPLPYEEEEQQQQQQQQQHQESYDHLQHLEPSFSFTNYDVRVDESAGWLLDFDPSASLTASTSPPVPQIDSIPHSGGSRGYDATSSCLAAAELIRTVRPDMGLAELERELGCADGNGGRRECKVPITHVISIINRVAQG